MGTGHSPADPGHAPRGHHEPRRPGRDHRLVQAAGVLTAGQDGSHQPRVAKTSAASSVNRSKFALVPLRAADNLLLVDADPVEMVRSGYNAISGAYRSDDDPAHEYDPWLAGLLERIPGRGQVLDIGCGCGVPVARRLGAAGHRAGGGCGTWVAGAVLPSRAGRPPPGTGCPGGTSATPRSAAPAGSSPAPSS